MPSLVESSGDEDFTDRQADRQRTADDQKSSHELSARVSYKVQCGRNCKML